FAQRFITLGGAVLQSGSALGRQNLLASFLETLDRKHLWCRQAACKGNNLRALRDLQQLTNRRAFNALGTERVTGRPGSRHRSPPLDISYAVFCLKKKRRRNVLRAARRGRGRGIRPR